MYKRHIPPSSSIYPQFFLTHPSVSRFNFAFGKKTTVDVGNPDSLNGPASMMMNDGEGASSGSADPGLAGGETVEATAGGEQLQQQHPLQAAGPPAKWICRATLRESPRAVKDVEFAPRHLGLRLAAAGADGVVRVYEAVDVMNLSHWPLQVCCVAMRGARDGKGWMDGWTLG